MFPACLLTSHTKNIQEVPDLTLTRKSTRFFFSLFRNAIEKEMTDTSHPTRDKPQNEKPENFFPVPSFILPQVSTGDELVAKSLTHLVTRHKRKRNKRTVVLFLLAFISLFPFLVSCFWLSLSLPQNLKNKEILPVSLPRVRRVCWFGRYLGTVISSSVWWLLLLVCLLHHTDREFFGGFSSVGVHGCRARRFGATGELEQKEGGGRGG